MNTQISHSEASKFTSAPRQKGLNPRQTLAVLSTIMALQMTSYAMMIPLFARRFDEFGAGVAALGMGEMAFALTATLSAPFMGALADKFGRRPLILGSLAAYAAAYLGYLLAPSTSALIILRGCAGALTAGLVPAVTGLATDLAPEDHRAQWIGFIMGGAAFGWVAGPVAGGLIFDNWGYNTALIVCILTSVITFLAALVFVQESKPAAERTSPKARRWKADSQYTNLKDFLINFRGTLPRSLSSFLILLFICFAVMFAWAFIGPEFMFYAYNDLGWSSSMVGFAFSTYALAMMAGEFTLGRLSDRMGRKPIIVLGLLLFSAQFLGLAFFRNNVPIMAAFLVAGLGNALYDPALTASILDISPAEHRARILGIKSTAGSIGNILGPALVVMVTSSLSARSIYMIAFGVVVLTIVASLTINTASRPPEDKSIAVRIQSPISPASDQGDL